jgi:hypothetical protein
VIWIDRRSSSNGRASLEVERATVATAIASNAPLRARARGRTTVPEPKQAQATGRGKERIFSSHPVNARSRVAEAIAAP